MIDCRMLKIWRLSVVFSEEILKISMIPREKKLDKMNLKVNEHIYSREHVTCSHLELLTWSDLKSLNLVPGFKFKEKNKQNCVSNQEKFCFHSRVNLRTFFLETYVMTWFYSGFQIVYKSHANLPQSFVIFLCCNAVTNLLGDDQVHEVIRSLEAV